MHESADSVDSNEWIDPRDWLVLVWPEHPVEHVRYQVVKEAVFFAVNWPQLYRQIAVAAATHFARQCEPQIRGTARNG